MARTPGSYSPAVPLGVTWEETIILEDEDGVAIDLTGYDVRCQLRAAISLRDEDTEIGVDDPLFELTTPDWYVSPPDWPVFEAWSIPAPANGTLLLSVDTADLWTASPTNEKVKLYWSILLVNPATLYALPVVIGKPSFLPQGTL